MKHLTRLICIACVLVLSVCLLMTPTLAKSEKSSQVIYDYANIIDDTEEARLTALAESYHKRVGDNRILVVTTSDYDSSAEAEARKLGYTSRSDSCFLLVIFASSARDYEYETYTLGDMSRFISNKTYHAIDTDGNMYVSIKSRNAVDGAERFITLAGNAALGIENARITRVWIVVGVSLLIGVIAGVVAAVIVRSRYRKKNRSASYPLNEFTSLNLAVNRDVFLGKTVITAYIPRNNSGGSRGGGFSRGGGGGRSGGRH